MTTRTKTPMHKLASDLTSRDSEPPRPFRTRTATGVPRSPLVLVAGRPGVGKSWAIAAAAADPRVSRVTMIEVGPGDVGATDAYGSIAGEKLRIVEHDGTAHDVVAAIQDAAQDPTVEGGYDILAIDSVTALRALLVREPQRGGRDIGFPGWAMLGEQWDDLLTVLTSRPGPTILTARVSDSPTDEFGQVRGEKDLQSVADVFLQADEHREFILRKARAVALREVTMPVALGDLDLPDLLDLLAGGAR